MAFLTDIDPRARVKGSRDPLALVPVWSSFGRKVVGNLTTVSNSVRGFTTLLLGYYLAREVEDNQNNANGSILEIFLKFEQLAGYSRLHSGKDGEFRGIERVKRNLNETKHIFLSASAEDQILSNQKVYGLWGLYSVPSRASGLLEQDELILTPNARAFIESQYMDYLSRQGFGDGRILRDLLSQKRPELCLVGKHGNLCRAIARILGPDFTAAERAFYREHLMLGGPNDRTSGLQAQLVDLLESVTDEGRPRVYLGKLINTARKRGASFAALAERLDRIDQLESLIAPSSIAFGFLLARNGQTISQVEQELQQIWRELHWLNLDRIRTIIPEITDAMGDSDSGVRWLKVAEAFHKGRYEKALRLLIEHNAFVMHARNGSEPWIRIARDKLDIRFRDESWNLPPARELPYLWYNSYFIDALRAVTETLKGN